MKKRVFFVTIIVALFLMSPAPLVIGGGLQEKIQSRLMSGKSNIQFQQVEQTTQATGEMQYEPYYDQGGARDQEADASNAYNNAIVNQQMSASHRQGAQPAEQMLGQAMATAVLAPNPLYSSYAVNKTDYKASIDEDVVTVEGKVSLEVFTKERIDIPFVSSSVGLLDVSINKGASFIFERGGRYYLVIDKPGRYELNVEFLIKASRERENGPGNFSFEILSAPISQFEFTMPETGVEIFVEPSIKTELKTEANKTVAWAVMPNTHSITVRWTKALPKETIAPAQLEPKVYADVQTYASVGEGLLRCQSSLNFSILQAEISNLRIAVPKDVDILEVQGQNLRDWKISSEDTQQYLDVYFNFGVKGNYVLNLGYERKIGEGSVVAEVPTIKVLGAERETGYLGLAASTNVELDVDKIEHANVIDVKELPLSIWSSTRNPVLLAFKYLGHPFQIAVKVTRHEEMPVLVAAIDALDVVTLQTQEGKVLTKAIYMVRNNVKQFLRLELSGSATLWSVFVSGKPVKPAKDKNGSILIPLEKSQSSGESLTQFPVEVVYLDQVSKMAWTGSSALRLPKVDLPISELFWSAYLPLDYRYFNFGGDVRRIEGQAPRGAFGAFTGGLQQVRHEVKKDKQAGYMRQSVDEIGEQFSPGYTVTSFKEEVNKVAGMMPIKISVPQEGRLYRFSKILITEKESPRMSFRYFKTIKHLGNLLRLAVLVFVIVFAVRLIRKRSVTTAS